jgi:hypothetical protein
LVLGVLVGGGVVFDGEAVLLMEAFTATTATEDDAMVIMILFIDLCFEVLCCREERNE